MTPSALLVVVSSSRCTVASSPRRLVVTSHRGRRRVVSSHSRMLSVAPLTHSVRDMTAWATQDGVGPRIPTMCSRRLSGIHSGAS